MMGQTPFCDDFWNAYARLFPALFKQCTTAYLITVILSGANLLIYLSDLFASSCSSDNFNSPIGLFMCLIIQYNKKHTNPKQFRTVTIAINLHCSGGSSKILHTGKQLTVTQLSTPDVIFERKPRLLTSNCEPTNCTQLHSELNQEVSIAGRLRSLQPIKACSSPCRLPEPTNTEKEP